ncbi:MAG: radical SAM protein [Acidobacteria bacterium]|nr:radical SAM protein [Acidobacteriota bacterium]
MTTDSPRWLRVHAVMPRTRANGPGVRFGIWVQGCARCCPGCFNPETHDPAGGYPVDVGGLARQVIDASTATDDGAGAIEGVSVSGGEPLEQPEALMNFLADLRRETSLSVVLFSGYSREEIERLPHGPAILAMTDILVAGPYEEMRHFAHDLRGSENQAVHFLTDRYTPCDLEDLPDAEIVIAPDGTVTRSGF